MAFSSGTADVGEDPVPLCGVSNAGARVRNRGGVLVYLGGPDVGYEGPGEGYPLEPGTSELFYGGIPKETAIVPAPPGDLDPETLYARTAPGTGIAKVSWIGTGG